MRERRVSKKARGAKEKNQTEYGEEEERENGKERKGIREGLPGSWRTEKRNRARVRRKSD